MVELGPGPPVVAERARELLERPVVQVLQPRGLARCPHLERFLREVSLGRARRRDRDHGADARVARRLGHGDRAADSVADERDLLDVHLAGRRHALEEGGHEPLDLLLAAGERRGLEAARVPVRRRGGRDRDVALLGECRPEDRRQSLARAGHEVSGDDDARHGAIDLGRDPDLGRGLVLASWEGPGGGVHGFLRGFHLSTGARLS